MPAYSPTTVWIPADDTGTLIPEDLKTALEADSLGTCLDILEAHQGQADVSGVAKYLADQWESLTDETFQGMAERMTSDDRAAFRELLAMSMPDEADSLGAYMGVAMLVVGLAARFGGRFRNGFNSFWNRLGPAQARWVTIVRTNRTQLRNHGIEKPGVASRMLEFARQNPGTTTALVVAAVLGGDYVISKATGNTPALTSLWQGMKQAGSAAVSLVSYLPLILIGAGLFIILKGK